MKFKFAICVPAVDTCAFIVRKSRNEVVEMRSYPMRTDQYQDELRELLTEIPENKRLEYLIEERELVDDEAPDEMCLQMLGVIDDAIAEVLKAS